MSDEEKWRKRKKLIKGLIGSSYYYPKPEKRSSKLILMRRQIFFGLLLWIGGLFVISFLFGRTPLAFFVRVYGIGGWLILMALILRYFYYFAFKKADR